MAPWGRSNLKVEYLGEYESISETALDHESGDKLDTLGEITFRQKHLISCPFNPFRYGI